MDYNYNAYEILGLDTNATREEVEQRYKQLREKYQKDRFLPGEAGEDASENLQRIEVAYRDILASMEESTQTEDLRQEDDYTEIQQLIKENKLDEAQTSLDNRVSRDAEWHYVQSILFYKRNWFLESKKQLELACQMEPDNQRYRHVDNGVNMGAGKGTCTGSACADCLLCNACCNCASCMGGGR